MIIKNEAFLSCIKKSSRVATAYRKTSFWTYDENSLDVVSQLQGYVMASLGKLTASIGHLWVYASSFFFNMERECKARGWTVPSNF